MLLGIEVQSIEEKPYLIITLSFIPLKIIENNLHFIWWIQNLFIHLYKQKRDKPPLYKFF